MSLTTTLPRLPASLLVARLQERRRLRRPYLTRPGLAVLVDRRSLRSSLHSVAYSQTVVLLAYAQLLLSLQLFALCTTLLAGHARRLIVSPLEPHLVSLLGIRLQSLVAARRCGFTCTDLTWSVASNYNTHHIIV